MDTAAVVRKFFRQSLPLAMVFLLSACAAPGPFIQGDYDRSADFRRYRTFGFFTPMGIENAQYSSIYGAVFRDAISRQMASRGYRPSSDPDLLINVSARLQEKTRVTVAPDPYFTWGYYGYRRGFYAPWGGYPFGSTTHIRSYTEGTVNIDIVDRAQKRMVWEGIAVGRLREHRTSEEVRGSIYAVVDDIFALYAFRAER